MKPIMKKVMGDGVEIQLAVWEGRGKTIFCVHGITANCRCWDVIAEALSPEFNLVAMDLRGRGLSEKPDHGYSVEAHCKDIRAVLENLGIKPVVIMGHSLGAFIALVFAALYSDFAEKVILVDGGGKLSPEQFEKVFAGIKPSLDRLGKIFSSIDQYMGVMRFAPFMKAWSSKLEEYYKYDVEELEGGKVRSRIRPESIAEESENLRKSDIAPFYPRVTCPVLILRATEGMISGDDLVLPEDVVEGMIQQIPHAKRVDIDGTNHYTILFQRDKARDNAIKSFIKE